MSNLNKKVIIGLAVFFMLALVGNFFYSIYAKMIDKSSYTDWISAFCNVVMAGATVAAVLTARNYLAQFIAQEGYKIAIQTVNELIPEIKKHTSEIKNEYERIEQYLNESMVVGNIYFDTSSQLTNRLISLSNELLVLKESLDDNISKIKTYGLNMDSSRYSSLNSANKFIDRNSEDVWDYTKKLNDYFSSLISSEYEWDKENKTLTVHCYDGRNLKLYDKTDKVYIEILASTKEMLSEASQAISDLEAVEKEPRHITKIFTV
ncbi:hypothetical protein ACNPN6_06555 [Enterobacter quasiroggenkampii]|uniref:hypothetical protein n=1 Tax=Enterobacter quasiroggenkampii TaxID=2497436 RepID=UPI003AB053C4